MTEKEQRKLRERCLDRATRVSIAALQKSNYEYDCTMDVTLTATVFAAYVVEGVTLDIFKERDRITHYWENTPAARTSRGSWWRRWLPWLFSPQTRSQ